jgi:hypothetical protein
MPPVKYRVPRALLVRWHYDNHLGHGVPFLGDFRRNESGSSRQQKSICQRLPIFVAAVRRINGFGVRSAALCPAVNIGSLDNPRFTTRRKLAKCFRQWP